MPRHMTRGGRHGCQRRGSFLPESKGAPETGDRLEAKQPPAAHEQHFPDASFIINAAFFAESKPLDHREGLITRVPEPIRLQSPPAQRETPAEPPTNCISVCFFHDILLPLPGLFPPCLLSALYFSTTAYILFISLGMPRPVSSGSTTCDAHAGA